MHISALARACATFGFTGVLLLAVANTASAHVSADAPGAARGGESAVVTFRVPNESNTATTTSVTVTLPSNAGLLSVRSAQLAGWAAAVTKTPSGVPTSVTWTARGGASIGAGQFGQFAIDVGPLPQASTIIFATTQTYSDGTVVQWNQPPNADGSEPEHPAPTLALATAAGEGNMPGMGGGKGVTAAGSTAAAAPAVQATSDVTARWLGGAGLLLGALGLGLAVGATARGRRRSA